MDIIRSKTNALVKEAKKLHQKKYRKTSYLIEGWHLLDEALKAGAEIERVFVREGEEANIPAHLPVKVVSAEIIQDLAGSPSPQGVVSQVALPVIEVPKRFTGRFLVLEDVQDPGNVGTMIRTADAAGFDGVFISDKTADIYNLKVLRSMQGSHFHLPIYRLPMEEIMSRLQASKVAVLATTLSTDSVDIRSVTPPQNLAIVMGNEGQGISSFVEKQADQLIHITMPGQAESLNVAVAAGIVLFSFI